MKVAFLDRDGVINKEKNYLYRIEDFEYVGNVIEGLRNLVSLGYHLIIITNQSGVARGFYPLTAVESLHCWIKRDLKRYGVDILDIFFCPHHPEGLISRYAIECDCRKPHPGMLTRAKMKYDIDMKNSLLIGDKLSDINAGKNAGIKNLFLVRSGHELTDVVLKDVLVFDDLYSVSDSLKG